MKKFLLTVALILAVVTSLTAGTLAAYNQTLSITGTDLVSKKFDFSAKGSQSFDTTVGDMTPGKTVFYKVQVTNNSEVPVDFVVNASLADNLSKSNGGPVVTEVLNSEKGPWNPSAVLGNEGGFEFYVKVTWPYKNDAVANALDYSMAKDKAKAQLKVTVNGTYAEETDVTNEGNLGKDATASYQGSAEA